MPRREDEDEEEDEDEDEVDEGASDDRAAPPDDPTRPLVERPAWWDAVSAGKTDEEIAADFDVDVVDAVVARERAMSAEGRRLLAGVSDQYAAYRVRMEGIIRRMERIHHAAMNPPPRSNGTRGRPSLRMALDASVAMARVIDRAIERGQDLGVLPRASIQKKTTVQVSGGVLVGAMSADELARGIRDHAKEGNRLRAEYTAGSFASLPIPDVYEADSDPNTGDQTGPVVSETRSAPAPDQGRPARRKA